MTKTHILPTNRTSIKAMNMNNLSDPIAAKEAQLRAKINRLQAQQRRQKLIEDLEQPKRKSTGIRFVSAFLVVLAIHVIGIGAFYGVSSIRKMRSSDKLALSSKPPVYAGVPESAPQTLKEAASTLEKTSPPVGQGTPGSGGNKSKLIATSAPTTPPIKTEARQLDPGTRESTDVRRTSPKSATSLKPSSAIKALFARGHTPTSISNRSSSSQVASECSPNVTKALSSTAHRDSEAPTITPVTTPRPTPAPPSHYTVGPGDTLSMVASMMGLPPSKIREANGLNSGNNLHVGQKLTIPPPDAHPPLQLVEKEPGRELEKSEAPEIFIPKLEKIAPKGFYTVQRGDNPYSVARRLRVSFTDLMTANAISNPADVTVGQHLKVPNQALASN